MSETITLTDAGPVEAISLPFVPGVVLLKGANDIGKSQGLEAISRWAGGDGDVTPRDGSKRMLATWQSTIAAGANVESPTIDELAAAAKAVQTAREAIEQAAVVRQARAKAAEADGHTETARNHRHAAVTLREAAKATDDVLSNAVASEYLLVEGGRLVTKCERGTVPYGERSQGTRWTIALDEAVRAIRELGADGRAVIVACQEAWESLDPDNRARVHQHCIQRGVTLYTAEAARGTLRAEVYEPEADAVAAGG